MNHPAPGEPDHFTIEYRFTLESLEMLSHTITVDEETLESQVEMDGPPPDWTKLTYHQCDGCPLTDTEYCPVALRLVKPLGGVKHLISYSAVDVTVFTDARTYHKMVDVQEALRSMFGLIMATSGCPVMKPFKLMARYHLPFSTIDETIVRLMSTYLLRQYFKEENEANLRVDLKEVEALYNLLGPVNQGMAGRIRAAVEADGALNALVIFNSFSQLIPIVLKDELNELRRLFT